MDERKPSILPSDFRLRSARPRIPADIDPPPAEAVTSDGLAAVGLSETGVAHIEQPTEPAKPTVRGAKP
jgi:hypothetical protein